MKLKLLCSILVLVICIFILSIDCYASDIISDIFDQQKSWGETGRSHTYNTIDTDNMNNYSDYLFSLFLGVGTVFAVVVGGILGIQFMTAGINEKVKVKETFLGYAISCLVMYSAFGIWQLVVKIMGNITG